MADQYPPPWFESEEQPAEAEWNDPDRRLQHQVEIQSRQIDQVLSRHEVPAGVSGGSVRPHWVSFDLASQLSGGWGRLRRLAGELTGDLTGELASALGVPEVKLERHNGSLRLAVKRSEPHPVDLLDLLELVPEAGNLSVAVGLDHQGQPVMLDLDQTDLHNVLIAGVSGAGKSSLMRSIAVSLALTCRQSLAQMAVIGLGSAPSGITTRPNPLYPVNYLPHLLFPVATEVDEAVEALAYLVEEVAYRADNEISSPALIIFIDDADMLLRRVGGLVAEQLATLLHAPAEAGVRVIVGASNPGLPDLWQMLQHNVDLRLVGRMADERSAQAATGLEKSYAQYLDGKGDFIALSAAGMEPFQAAYIDDYDLHLTLTELHRLSSPVLLAQSINDEPALPPAWSISGERSFTYDAGKESAKLDPQDRSDLRAIEIAVDPYDGEERPREHLSWLDDVNGNGVPGGLALPLYGDEPVQGPATDDLREDTEANFGGPAPRADFSEPGQANSPAAAAGVGPYQLAHGEAPETSSSGVEDSAAGVADDGARYEMLPFDDEPQDDGPELAGNAPPAEQLPTTMSPAPEIDSGPGDEAGLGQDEDRYQEQERQVVTSHHSGRRDNQVRPERAQTLWSVEPIYTDIDDDLWDAPEAEDDWRKRLH